MVGVHVILDIIPQRIDPAAWAEAFEETRLLLQAHPARLLGYGFRLVAGVRVPVFTRSVEQGGDDPAERRWCVVGDRATLGTGERQRMYRDLGRYLARCPAGQQAIRAVTDGEEDILASVGIPAAAGSPATARVFGEGGQSEPCRLGLLAAAMVVETRFPRHALVSGSFDREQAETARRWANGLLERSVALPVRVDAWRLVERLGARLAGEALVQAVDRLYLADPGTREAALLAVLGRAALAARKAPLPSPDPPPTGSAGEAPIEALAALASPGELEAGPRRRLHALARAVRETRSRVEDHGGAVSTGAARLAIASLLARGGPTLTEDAWDWIEREEDAELCAFLAALAAFEPADAETASLRRVLLENRALCRYAAGV